MFHIFLDQLFEPDPMEYDLNPWDLYKGAKEDYMIHVFELVEFEALPVIKKNKNRYFIQGSSRTNKQKKKFENSIN